MPIDPRVDIGHVHLKVSDIERALGFYRDVLGFEVMARYGDEAVFISAGEYHHHLGLNTWESKDGSPPPRGTTGLFHVAIRYPDRRTLAQAVRAVLDAGIPLDGASDHGVSEAIYLHDPDENGIELYRDRPQQEWPRDGDRLDIYTAPLDLQASDDGPRAGRRLAVLRRPRAAAPERERQHQVHGADLEPVPRVDSVPA